MNSSYKACLIFFILLLIPFLIKDVEAQQITQNITSSFTAGLVDPYLNATITTTENKQNLFILVSISMRDKENDIADWTISIEDATQAGADTEINDCETDKTFLLDLVLDSRFGYRSVWTEYHFINFNNLAAGDYIVCAVHSNNVISWAFMTVMLWQNVYLDNPIGSVVGTSGKGKDRIILPCIDEGNSVFGTIARKLNRSNPKTVVPSAHDDSFIETEFFKGKLSSAYKTNQKGFYNFTWTNIGINQQIAISALEINGVQPAVGCPVYPHDSLGISDSISIHLTKTLTESLVISDSVSTKAHYVRNLFDGISISDLLDYNTGAKITKTLTETLSISGLLDYHKDYTKSLTETIGILDILDYILSDPPIVEPEPVQAVTVQKSSVSSSGGGRTGVSVSPKISDTAATTSMDRIATWLSTPEHFQIALHNLIQQDIVDLEVSQIRDPPGWFYTTVEFWTNKQIDDQEFFNALSYILKN